MPRGTWSGEYFSKTNKKAPRGLMELPTPEPSPTREEILATLDQVCAGAFL